MRIVTCLVFLIAFVSVNAKDPYPKNDAIDILHYRFQLEVNDTTDVLTGQAWVSVLFKKSVSEFELDLVNRNQAGNGMQVSEVRLNNSPLKFTHQNDRLKIILPAGAKPGSHVQILVRYSGIPQDGLIIGKNKFGDRTFFGDNWPDRAHHWLPTIDHPSDKATCEFEVIAPEYYSVIGNGRKTEESAWTKKRKLTRWEESAPISTKVMVVGIARFAIQEAGRVEGIAVESWIYPQNRLDGFSDYAKAVNILDFFIQHVGPYSYEKIANVQSTTRYGGMENASAIFYAEGSVSGKNEHEGTIAHEVAHQWFGNSASEKDWHHVWLSEGFATYLSHAYMEFAYGHDVLIDEMKTDRDQVIDYFKSNPHPIIDTTITKLMSLLNTNSYQKGSWVLHMLRHEMGDTDFWKGLRNYYQAYRNSNALTGDFQRIMEEACQKDLSAFFQQWLWRGGHPQLAGQWKYDGTGQVTLIIDQLSKAGPFTFPLDVGFHLAGGEWVVKTVKVEAKSQKFTFPIEKKPLEVTLDPKTWLLFEGQIQAK